MTEMVQVATKHFAEGGWAPISPCQLQARLHKHPKHPATFRLALLDPGCSDTLICPRPSTPSPPPSSSLQRHPRGYLNLTDGADSLSVPVPIGSCSKAKSSGSSVLPVN
jgi:hypothetical protein